MDTTRARHHNHSTGFTILEILIVISIVAVGFTAIFLTIQNSNTLMSQSKAKTLTINLSREAVEMTHNIRDTNRTRRSGNKDACRLKADPLANSNEDCSNDPWIQAGRYTIEEKISEDQKYFILEPFILSGSFDRVEDALGDISQTQLCYEESRRVQCTTASPEGPLTILRAIHVLGLYDKTADSPDALLLCENGANDICGGATPKELRFCSHTHYISNTHHQTTLCSSMTNFSE